MAIKIMGSNMQANAGYGQNGDCSPSSVTPGSDCGKSGFLPAITVPTENTQTRDVGKSNVQTTFGMTRQTKD